MPRLEPGDWTPTGWGSQHRIRDIDDDRVTLVCHPADQWAHASRVDTDASEADVCSRCRTTPGLGPMPAPIFGEVRRGPGGIVVACLRMWDGRTPASPADRCWRVLDAAGTSACEPLDSYAVAGWDVCGSVPAISTEARL